MNEPNDSHGVRRLELRIEPYDPVTVDEFEVKILIDDEDLLADQRFAGFDPWDILRPVAPLLPPSRFPGLQLAAAAVASPDAERSLR